MATPIENNTEGLQEILQRVQNLPQGINADDFVKKTELQDAVDEALEQAKNSGEFDGKDGTSVSHTWSGTTLRVTSASGTSSADLKGEKGDTGSFDTSQIVNNFNTTEAGYVADARALKTLNDTKISLELLWENASPGSEFAAKNISLNLSGYEFILISCRRYTTVSYYVNTIANVGQSVMLFVAFTADGDYRFDLNYRSATVSTSRITFDDATGVTAASAKATDNKLMIPYRIYGIKEVS